MVCAAEDFDFDTQKEHGDLGLVDVRETDGVFFRGDQGVERAPVAPFEEAEDFFFGKAVMVGKCLGHLDHGTEFAYAFLETLGPRDTTEGPDMPSVQVLERVLHAGLEILPMTRGVAAFDDGRRTVQGTQAGKEGFVRFWARFGHDDVGCAAKVGRWFAEGSSGQQMFVPEG